MTEESLPVGMDAAFFCLIVRGAEGEGVYRRRCDRKSAVVLDCKGVAWWPWGERVRRLLRMQEIKRGEEKR